MFFSGTHDLVMRLDILIFAIYIRSLECKIIDILHACTCKLDPPFSWMSINRY